MQQAGDCCTGSCMCPLIQAIPRLSSSGYLYILFLGGERRGEAATAFTKLELIHRKQTQHSNPLGPYL